MDRVIEKTRTQQLKKYWLHLVSGCLVLGVGSWLVFGHHASTLKVNRDELTISDVQRAEFKDYVRTNGQVMPIQIVQISPEEGAGKGGRRGYTRKERRCHRKIVELEPRLADSEC